MSGLRLFYFILVGQSLSLLGSTLTNFALGVWAFQTGGSVTNFTLIATASTLPGIVLGPVIGSLVDRWDRKKVLLGAQIGSALVTLTLAVLYWGGTLQVWHIIAIVPLASVFSTVLQIGFTSMVSTLVPQEGLSRANGSLGLVFGVVQLSGPILAGITLDRIGLDGIFFIDIASYAIGLLTLAVVTLPPLQRKLDEKAGSLWSDIAEGYRFLRSKPGVLGGLYLFTLIWFNVSAVQVLILPLVLSIGTSTDLGFIQSMAGVGTLIGGIAMVVWKGPQRKTLGILSASVVIACVLIAMPILPSIAWIAVCVVVIMMAAPVASVCSQTLWQKKVPLHFHGRAFSMRNTIMKAAQPLAFLSAGVLADHIFEPMMQQGEWLAALFGSVWGVGEGRGVALMISFFGLLSLVIVASAWLTPAIRRADLDLPDENLPISSQNAQPLQNLEEKSP